MEELLHYAWKHKIFPLKELYTTTGALVEVIDPGLPNRNAGPDFFNAKLKLDGTLWVGNVEIHTQATDWLKHGHDRDRAYDSVVLHVVGESNCDVCRSTGEPIPQLVLPVPQQVRERYSELSAAEIQPPCYTILPALPKLIIHSWLSALQVERLQQKTELITARLQRLGNHWEDAFFITLARNFGFGLNGDAFEAWAGGLPFRAIDKHRDNLFQVEAFFFGQAGLLEDEAGSDDYYQKLQSEYRYLRHKFSLGQPLDASRWKFLRLRPGNFPHVRLAQLAALYHREHSLFSRLMEAESIEAIKKILSNILPSSYWEEHFTFQKSSPRRAKQVGDGALNLIIINTVVPFLYAYGRHKAEERLCERATQLLENLKAENNHITRLWEGAGLPITTAADSQALIQLTKEYCDKRNCLRCRFGYEFLKGKK
ncbi:MAG: DUF2851 family protein [Bacteroides sp.]|nr:DUF2851 family protein [Bacteroides sp.]